jgi:hypothetical protein
MVFHCIIQPDTLRSSLLFEITEVMGSGLHSSNTLSHHQFKHFLDEVGSEYDDAFDYWAVRRLIRDEAFSKYFFSFAKWNRHFPGGQGQHDTTILK